MMTRRTPSGDVLARLFGDGDAQEGICVIASVENDGAGSYTLNRICTVDNCPAAIERAGNLSSRGSAVLVVTYCQGAPLVLARYGDTPRELA